MNIRIVLYGTEKVDHYAVLHGADWYCQPSPSDPLVPRSLPAFSFTFTSWLPTSLSMRF